MNPFQRLGVKISNWWRGEPQDSGGVVTLNSPSFLERIGLKRKGKPTSEVTYFTCLKMLSETLAKMPIKYYQKRTRESLRQRRRTHQSCSQKTESVYDTQRHFGTRLKSTATITETPMCT